MDFDLDAAITVLERTPATLRAWLGGLDEGWTRANRGAETFSPFDLVGHLIHGERTDWMPRARIILAQGERVPFEPFDRFAQVEASRGKGLEELLATFAELRARNLEELRALDLGPAELARTGTHPALGRVSLRELLATWVVHDLDHLGQIARTLAWQYRGEVGPWGEYLPILTRT